MVAFGRLQRSTLLLCAVCLCLIGFGGGFVAAICLGGLDTDKAAAIAGNAVRSSEYAATMRRSLLDRATYMARRPAYAAATMVAPRVQGLFRNIPAALKPLSPQKALEEALRQQSQGSIAGVTAATGQLRDAALGTLTPGSPATAPTPATLAAPVAAVAAVAEKPPPIRELPPAAPLSPTVFAVELGSFREPAAAVAFAAEMERRTLAVAMVNETDATGRDWHYVRLGPFPSETVASQRLADLREQDDLPGIVVREARVEKKS